MHEQSMTEHHLVCKPSPGVDVKVVAMFVNYASVNVSAMLMVMNVTSISS